MIWRVGYIQGGTESCLQVGSREVAIDSACELLAAGKIVTGIGTGRPDDAVGANEIAEIHAQREAFRRRNIDSLR